MRRECPNRDVTTNSNIGSYRENNTLQVQEMYRLCYNNSGSGVDSSEKSSLQNASNYHAYDTKVGHQSTVNEIYHNAQTSVTNVFVDGEIAIANTKFRCLVDTGSQKTIINEAVWDKIKSETQEAMECKHVLSAANGQTLSLIGATRTNLRIG